MGTEVTPVTAPVESPVAEPAAQTATFGRLESAKIRDYWVDEARDFTPWLAKQENLDLLGETIGLSLELVGIEQRVGPFKADIVATDGNSTVIVENQLDATDHKHLGQLLVYAAGRSASTVVWIAKAVTDEYRKVIDWLNDETSADFWALEIELWRIGDSPVAPKFNVVCEPNELTKAPDVGSAELSDTKLLQLEFWTGFSDFLESTSFNPRKPRPQHWYDLPIGTTRAHIYLNALVTFNPGVQCGLYIKTQQASLIFERLATDKASIEAELGTPELKWEPLPEKMACRIGVHRDADLRDRDSWPELYQWLGDLAERFKTVFSQRVKDMDLPVLDDDGTDAPAEAVPVVEPSGAMSAPATNGSIE